MMFEKFDDMLYGWCWDEAYTATHEVRPTMSSTSDYRELLVTRQKLETRTWLLRITTGLLVSTWAGIAIYVANQIN
jgi:hypothetical protein